MAAHLRVFPTTLENEFVETQKPSVRVRLGELLPLIALGKRRNYLWLEDFLDDAVCITPDLYEVLRTFCTYRPSA